LATLCSFSIDHPDRAPGQRGLENIRRVHAAAGRSGTQQQMDFIDEKNRLRLLRCLAHYRFQAFLEFSCSGASVTAALVP
jgi:hypothetical protein